MVRRLFWLVITLLLPLCLLLFAVDIGQGRAAGNTAAPYDVIINEWSQGESGNKEWVELLVVNGSLDLRGWDLGDNSPGDLTFANNPFWANVSAGSLIVIYNGNDPDNNILPPNDSDWSDCVVILPHNSPLFTGSWPLFSNTTPDDNPVLRDSGDNVIHDFTAAPGSTVRPGVNQATRFNSGSVAVVGEPGHWSKIGWNFATPGTGNTVENSAWISALCQGSNAPMADLQVAKTGPAAVSLNEIITYTISLQNSGRYTATDVILTDTLPLALSYAGDNSGFTVQEPIPNTLIWEIGAVPTGTLVTFQLTATIQATTAGNITNTIRATTSYTETSLSNNIASAVTYLDDGLQPTVLLYAVYYDGYALGDIDEAVALINVGQATANLGGWRLSNGSSQTIIPANILLAPGEMKWLARSAGAAAFALNFGFLPDVLLASWPGFANTGDEVILLDASGTIQDALVYKTGNTGQNGWLGPAVQPYVVTGVFGEEGQVLYRRLEQATGRPVPDTNSAADWSSWADDVINGRKVRYPGWDLEQFFFTRQITETGVITIAIAPDNAYETVVAALDRTQHTIQIETQTFENLGIADALVRAAGRGVSVTVLLEGAPPGGIPDQEKYICAQIEDAGGACWFMISDSTNRIYDRYRFLHAKFVLLDGQRVIISSENLSPNSMPYDDKNDGTWGRRGVVLMTDAPGVVQHVRSIFAVDFEPAAHADLFRWDENSATYGLPSVGFMPITVTGGITYPVRYAETAVFNGIFSLEIIQSPENSLRDLDGLLGLLNRAGTGDMVLSQQLTERPYWGSSNSNPTADPNPRLEALINAARRGATVRILLDSFFDVPSAANSNAATCRFTNSLALTEQLDLRCAVNNPTGLGIHNKMVLAQIGGQGFVHIGSINGTEQSNKGNRELAIQVQSNEIFALLSAMFYQDWPWRLYLPIMLKDYIAPANYVLISEVLYDPPGLDDAEFIELVNPTNFTIDISNYSIGDAVNRTDFEDVRRFPPGTFILPGRTLVIATTATGFYSLFGFNPDFEILDTDSAVPSLIDDPSWGDPNAFLQLGNQGDEVILRDANDNVVDVVTYGTGFFPGVISCPLVPAPNQSLERFPYWRDTDNCAADFRIWPFPNPGRLP